MSVFAVEAIALLLFKASLLFNPFSTDTNEPASEAILEESTAFWLSMLEITACVETDEST